MIKKLLAVLFLPAALFANPGQAQWKPAEPIKFMHPGAPGSTPDQVARAVADRMGEKLGQQVQVVSKVGASGVVVAREVLGQPANGLHILQTNATMMAGVPTFKKDIGFDTLKDFKHIATLSESPRVLAVRADFPADDFATFVKVVKANPGKFNFAGAPQAIEYLYAETIKKREGLDFKYVPYNSQPQFLPDLVAGRLDMCACNLSAIVPYLLSGRIKMIAVSWPTRVPEYPSTANWKELGYPELSITAWYGIAVHKDTPQPVVDAISEAAAHALKDQTVVGRLRTGLNYPLIGGPAKATELVTTSLKDSRKMGDAIGVKPD